MSRPALPVLWPERFAELEAGDRLAWQQVIGQNIPATYHDLVKEAAQTKMNIDLGTIEGYIKVPSVNRFFTLMKRRVERGDMDEILEKVPAANLVGSELYATYSIRRWKHHGSRVYLLDDETFEIMQHMEPPPMPADLLRMPQGCFYLVFPPKWNFTIGQETLQPVEGVMVVMCGPSEKRRYNEVIMLTCGRSHNEWWDDNIVYMTFHMNPDRTLDMIQMPPGEIHDLPRGNADVGKLVPRIVFNFCLYMMTQHPYIEPVPPSPIVTGLAKLGRKKQKRTARKLTAQSRVGYIWVGARPKYDNDGAGLGRKIDRPYYVRAHWRWQACGPKWTERKLLLVKEHIRGAAFEDRPGIRAGRVQQARFKENKDGGPKGTLPGRSELLGETAGASREGSAGDTA